MEMEKIVQMCVKFNDEAMRKRINLNKLTRLFFPPDKFRELSRGSKNFYDIIRDLFTNEQFSASSVHD